MRILWHSNAPYAPTGYGDQTNVFAPRLNESHDLAISCFYGLEGAPIKWRGIPLLPGLGGEWGNPYITDHAKHWFDEERKGLLLTLMDVWVLDPAQIGKLNTACWTPIDHEPLPPKIKDFFEASGAIPIAMSRFGEEQLAEFDPVYVPHGVDTKVMHPYPQEEVRKLTGTPKDAFLVGMVAANKGRNPSRKGFQEALAAFAAFRQKHPDALLYLHTVLDPRMSDGEDLTGLMASFGIPPEAVLAADPYRMMFNPVSKADMAQIMSTFDVLLNPAMGEGFGIPIVEAQACEVPVIATDFSAMKETAAVGWRVEGTPFWTAQKAWQMHASVDGIYSALEDCYEQPAEEKAKMKKRARGHALNYEADKVLTEHFLPALAELAERMGLDLEQPAEELAAA